MSDPKEFWLYDLRVEVVAGEQPMVCNHRAGDYFLVQGENIIFGEQGSFPLYPLAALLPLLPAKQRDTQQHDWMSTDAEVACPDPYCGARFRITRIGKRTYSHAGTTGLPEQRGKPYWQNSGQDNSSQDNLSQDSLSQDNSSEINPEQVESNSGKPRQNESNSDAF